MRLSGLGNGPGDPWFPVCMYRLEIEALNFGSTPDVFPGPDPDPGFQPGPAPDPDPVPSPAPEPDPGPDPLSPFPTPLPVT